jgi:outer membrane protein assembly factor BamB
MENVMELKIHGKAKKPAGLKWLTSLFLLFLVTAVTLLPACGGSQSSNTARGTGKNERIVACFTSESSNAFLDATPTIIDDFIYIGTSTKITYEGDHSAVLAGLPEGFFYKMDLDFNIIWKYSLGKAHCGGGAALDSKGNIYFLSSEHAVDTTGTTKGYLAKMYLNSLTPDGQFRWQYQVSAENQEWLHSPATPAIGADDTIYIGNSRFFAFSPDGTLKWRYPDNDTIIMNYRGSPIIDNQGYIYFVSPEPDNNIWGTEIIRAYKFTASGDIIWSSVMDNELEPPEGGYDYPPRKERWILSTPAFSAGYKSLYVAVGVTINKVDLATGEIIWSLVPEGATGSFKASPAVDAEDNIYLGTKSNKESTMFAIKADGSGLIWKKLIGADLYSSPLLGDDGVLYFGSEGTENGHFHAVDMKTGTAVWDTGYDKNPMPDIGLGSPALYKSFIYLGVYSVTDDQGQRLPELQALHKIKVGAKDYLPGSPWPRFHGSNSSNGRGMEQP